NQLPPDQLTAPLLWAGLLWSLCTPSRLSSLQAIIGASACSMTLMSISWVLKQLTGREDTGYGDFTLLAGITPFTGVRQLPFALMTSSICGALIGVIVLGPKSRTQPIPFGPFLIGGGLLSYFYGTELLLAYWHWLGVS